MASSTTVIPVTGCCGCGSGCGDCDPCPAGGYTTSITFSTTADIIRVDVGNPCSTCDTDNCSQNFIGEDGVIITCFDEVCCTFTRVEATLDLGGTYSLTGSSCGGTDDKTSATIVEQVCGEFTFEIKAYSTMTLYCPRQIWDGSIPYDLILAVSVPTGYDRGCCDTNAEVVGRQAAALYRIDDWDCEGDLVAEKIYEVDYDDAASCTQQLDITFPATITLTPVP